MGGYRDYVNKALLDKYATACDKDVTLLVVELLKNMPFKLPGLLAEKALGCFACGACQGADGERLLECT